MKKMLVIWEREREIQKDISDSDDQNPDLVAELLVCVQITLWSVHQRINTDDLSVN